MHHVNVFGLYGYLLVLMLHGHKKITKSQVNQCPDITRVFVIYSKSLFHEETHEPIYQQLIFVGTIFHGKICFVRYRLQYNYFRNGDAHFKIKSYKDYEKVTFHS